MFDITYHVGSAFGEERRQVQGFAHFVGVEHYDVSKVLKMWLMNNILVFDY